MDCYSINVYCKFSRESRRFGVYPVIKVCWLVDLLTGEACSLLTVPSSYRNSLWNFVSIGLAYGRILVNARCMKRHRAGILTPRRTNSSTWYSTTPISYMIPMAINCSIWGLVFSCFHYFTGRNPSRWFPNLGLSFAERGPTITLNSSRGFG